MSSRLEEISRRKQALVERCGEERAELGAAYRQIRSPFHLSTALGGIGRILKTYPLIVGGISSLLVNSYSGKLTRSAGNLVKLGRLALPVWAWITKRSKRH